MLFQKNVCLLFVLLTEFAIAGSRSASSLFPGGSNRLGTLDSDIDGSSTIRGRERPNVIGADKNDTIGEVASSRIFFGDGNPDTARIGMKLRLSSSSSDRVGRHHLQDHRSRHRQLTTFPSTGTLKNLVILMRFKNHENRILPTVQEFEYVLNHNGETDDHHKLAPTGSVKDVFRINSYGKFNLESTVYGWVDLPENEAYYAAGIGGFATAEYLEALHDAMDSLRDDIGISSFREFDANNDGKIDMVTLVHSGYASEANGPDEDGAENDDRIWSHHRKLRNKSRWYPDPSNKNGDAYVYQYATVPALYGVKGTSIGRIGVTSHEIGHAIGLPDLYGTPEGNGLGSYDFMSNHWGFPRYFELSQLYPPILSPWSKIKAGWLDPIVIDKSGTFNITASYLSDQIYKINMNQEGTEYLLIENRQAIGFEKYLPQGGLAIWHIDEKASNVEGYPGQKGIQWPLNKKHYMVSLLQADGRYDLEKRENNGDAFDLFHKDGIDHLAPSINFIEGPYPSTDSYKDTMPVRTGIWIHDIGKSDLSMTFQVTLMQEVSTPFLGGNGASGNMFDVLPTKDIAIQKLYLNLDTEDDVQVELWTRTGTHVSYEDKPWLWQRPAVVVVEGNGRGKKSCMHIADNALILNANTRYGFYLVVATKKFRYTNGMGVGSVVVENEDLTIYEGSGLTRPFGKVYNNRIFNGNLFYDVVSSEQQEGKNTAASGHHQRRLETTFDGGFGQDGIMFNVLPKEAIAVNGFDLHLIDTNETSVRIYTKEGSFAGSENQPEKWTLVANTTVVGSGINLATRVVLDKEATLHLTKDTLRAFYIDVASSNGRGLRYTRGSETTSTPSSSSNEDLIIFQGVGVSSNFGSTFPNRVWNGALHYEVMV